MPKVCYVPKTFREATLEIIEQANEIIEEYTGQGFDLTLRQLYYQFVARALLENTDRSYTKLGTVVNDARLAGLIDWDCIKDRTRFLRELPHWDSPRSIMMSAARNFQLDKWADQEFAVECWIEKDALIGVITDVCEDLDIPHFACRGYISQSFMYEAGVRLRDYIDDDRTPVILHLGDHDPSGIDMTRDIGDRLDMFADDEIEVKRLALNMDQIEQYSPPPNPAKLTDSRAQDYCSRFGYDSWELDALEPSVIVGLIEDAMLEFRDDILWEESKQREEDGRRLITRLASQMNS